MSEQAKSTAPLEELNLDMRQLRLDNKTKVPYSGSKLRDSNNTSCNVSEDFTL
jgi:hypothetical protein